MDIKNPFETFEHSAFRLEALPTYVVPEEKKSFEEFQRTGLVGELKSDWSRVVLKNATAGKKMERLRLLSRDLSDYERYEIQAYSGPKNGESIRTALRDEYSDQYKYDFWFFDEQWIAHVHYETDGTFIDFDMRRASAEELEMYRYWRSVFENAHPLKQVPFVANTDDDTHCLQAAYMSIAKYFDPNFSVSMDEWAQLTGYEEGLGTWANAGLVWFAQHGYEVKHYEVFDFDAFMKSPKQYMIALHGEMAGTWGYEHTNVPAETERMQQLLSLGLVEQREPTIADITSFLDNGWLVRVVINAHRLAGEEEYVGHAITITSYSDTHVTFHDPGLPPMPNRTVPWEEFEAAWSDQARELDAIRLMKQ